MLNLRLGDTLAEYLLTTFLWWISSPWLFLAMIMYKFFVMQLKSPQCCLFCENRPMFVKRSFSLIWTVAFYNSSLKIFSGKSFGSPDTLSPKSVGIALNNYSDQSGEFPQWKPWIFSGMPSAEAFSHISKLYFPEHLFKLFMLSGMMIQMLHLLF